jgi:hypothetical protein
MYEVFAGKGYFEDLKVMTLKREVIAGKRPPLPTEWPKAVRNVISGAWVGEPRLRPRFEDISKDLTTYLENCGNNATPRVIRRPSCEFLTDGREQ